MFKSQLTSLLWGKYGNFNEYYLFVVSEKFFFFTQKSNNSILLVANVYCYKLHFPHQSQISSYLQAVNEDWLQYMNYIKVSLLIAVMLSAQLLNYDPRAFGPGMSSHWNFVSCAFEEVTLLHL